MDNIEMTFNQGSLLWSIIMSGMIKPSKKIYAKELGIPDDYDDCWFYNKFWCESLPIRTRLQFLDFHTYMPCMVLTKVDRTSMAVSLEARVPLLSKDIIEFSFSLPEKIRLYKNQSKGIFKEAYRNILPNQILDRKKQGFGLPSYYLKDINEGRPIQEHILNNFLHKKAN
jgi:asparagine synthase (glutamine-hydrolysing)